MSTVETDGPSPPSLSLIAAANKKLVVGIDPGYATLGLALRVLGGTRIWHTRLFRTSAKLPFDVRLWRLRDELHRELITILAGRFADRFSLPGVIGIERQDQVAAAESAARRTDRNVLLVQQVVGMLKGLAWELGWPIVEVDPQTAKRALGGSRSATKAQMQKLALTRLSFTNGKLSEHEADALGVAVATEGKLLTALPVPRGRR